MDNVFLLMDRVQKIQQIVNQYGEQNFYISFSGGKDSTVLSALVDMALPDNKIPRVYANTGIEINMIRDFVFEKAKNDERVVIIKPQVPIKDTLENEGYPFKSKKHSALLKVYQKYKTTEGLIGLQCYLRIREDGKTWSSQNSCPQILKHQFEPTYKLKISDMCCLRMKEEPLKKWAKENNKPYTMIGIMREEGGRRSGANCLSFRKEKLQAFQPLVAITKEWEEWFIEHHNVEICAIYKPPYNFRRTGCKGCPFALDLQKELDVLEKFFPEERKQCEYIWAPVYKEYRKLGYRLRKDEKLKLIDDLKKGQIEGQTTIFDFEE